LHSGKVIEKKQFFPFAKRKTVMGREAHPPVDHIPLQLPVLPAIQLPLPEPILTFFLDSRPGGIFKVTCGITTCVSFYKYGKFYI
jgi:hypothetical protein